MTELLASIDELRAALRRVNAELSQFEGFSSPELGALDDGGLTDAQVEDLERIFSCTLPETFRACVQKYDLSCVTIGPAVFSTERTYFDELVSSNRDTTWWCGSPWVFPEASRQEPRPQNLLLIGDRDPYFLLLNVRDGTVLALDVERLYPDAVRVAGDLTQFLQCSGALWLASLRNQPLDEVREEVVRVTRGDPQFWSA